MALIHSALFDGASGRIGGLVFRQVNGKTRVGWRPRPSSRPPSDAQLAQREYFRRAAAYGNAVKNDPARHAVYAAFAAEKNITVYATAVRDWLKPPEITAIDLDHYRGQAGDLIRVNATDDTAVAEVTVQFRACDGSLLEQGAAVRAGPCWEYRATSTIPGSRAIMVEVTAADHARNQTSEVRMVGTP
jgi:hypothetical protein